MSITEVARRAGVSTATVSRVLNGSINVGEQYRRSVLDAVEQLDYRPNRLASNLRRKKTAMIGVVVADIENPHFAEMVRAVEDAAYRHGLRVLLCNSDETASKQQSYLEVLAAERVAGVILSPSDASDPNISELLDLNIPIVAVDRVVDDIRADAVVGNNVRAARTVTRHLIDAGHEVIGFVGGRPQVMTGGERLKGYETAMQKAGLEARSRSGAFRIRGGRKAAEHLLEELRPTGLVVANNLMTVGALQAIRSRGMSIPRDIALVAIDDPPWAELLDPPLTTMAQPIRLMATSAIDVLVERIASGSGPARQIVFDFELRVRGSCGVENASKTRR